MSRRQLPPRSTRGQKPSTTNQQQQRKDNLLYERMFGKDLDDQADYAEKQAKDQIRKNIMVSNIKQYAYSRGYHYFYDLNQFSRLDGHPSYAIQHLNLFGSTYSKQDTEYKGSKLSQLINRVYIGLPIKDGIPHVNKQDKCKNICHGYLFDTQDKKYLLDRTINTYKKVYKNLQKITSLNKIRLFKLIKNDAELSVLMDGSQDISIKQQALLRRILVLQQRKNNNISNWLSDDKSFYHHSLNQQLHNKICDLKDEYSIQKIGTILFINQSMLSQLIQSQIQDVTQFLKISMRYYNTVEKVLSSDTIQQIQDKCAINILKDNGSEQSNINFPTQIFSFGSPQLLAQVNCIIGSRIFRYNQTNYYSAKFAWKKIFDCDLLMTPKGQQKSLIYEQYSKIAKEQVATARQFFFKMKNQGRTVEAVKCPLLDNLINWQKIQGENVPSNTKIFVDGQTKKITGKQFVIVVLYDWLCKGFNQLMPYLSINPQFQQIFTYEYFNKFSHGIVEAAAKPIVGIISSCLDILCDFISKQDPFQGLDLQLHFEFHKDQNIGILWRLKEEQVWETQSEQIGEDPEEDKSNEDNQQEQGHLIPTKKIKQE